MRLLASRVYLSLQLSRRWKLVVFSCAMLSNAISVANVFPYAPLMVEHLGMTHDRRELGFYAGFLMASYMIGSMLTQYHLGMLCDRWGRKKVILLGLASGTLPQLLFGLSRTFGFACAWRFTMGFPNGVVVAGKVMAPELVSARDQGLVMSLIAGMWGLGNVIGPAIGGLLAETGPEDSVLGEFPYLLPNALCAAIALAASLLVALYLPETRTGGHASTASQPRNDARETSSRMELPTATLAGSAGALSSELPETPADTVAPRGAEPESISDVPTACDERHTKMPGVRQPSSRAAAAATLAAGDGARGSSPRVRCPTLFPRRAMTVVIAYCALAFTAITFDEVLPLWLVAPRSSGGMGFALPQVGGVLTVSGVSIILWQLCLMPFITRTFSHTQVFKSSCFASAFAIALVPANAHVQSGHGLRWPLLVLSVVACRFAQAGAFTTVFILINNSVEARARGRVQGLAMAAASAMRASGPVVGSCLFAWSLTNGLGERLPLLGAPFAFLLCSVLFLTTGTVAVLYMPPAFNSPMPEDGLG